MNRFDAYPNYFAPKHWPGANHGFHRQVQASGEGHRVWVPDLRGRDAQRYKGSRVMGVGSKFFIDACSLSLVTALDSKDNRYRTARDHAQLCDHQIHELRGSHVIDQIQQPE